MIEELNKLIENSIEISGLKIDLIDYDKELSDEELVINECYYVKDDEKYTYSYDRYIKKKL